MMCLSARPQSRPRGPRAARGFTLIEVLVSLLILSVLAASAWKGLDAISTARQVAEDNLQQTLRLQAVMTQFETDLAQVLDTLLASRRSFIAMASSRARPSRHPDCPAIRFAALAIP